MTLSASFLGDLEALAPVKLVGAGDVDYVGPMVLERLRRQPSPPTPSPTGGEGASSPLAPNPGGSK